MLINFDKATDSILNTWLADHPNADSVFPHLPPAHENAARYIFQYVNLLLDCRAAQRSGSMGGPALRAQKLYMEGLYADLPPYAKFRELKTTRRKKRPSRPLSHATVHVRLPLEHFTYLKEMVGRRQQNGSYTANLSSEAALAVAEHIARHKAWRLAHDPEYAAQCEAEAAAREQRKEMAAAIPPLELYDEGSHRPKSAAEREALLEARRIAMIDRFAYIEGIPPDYGAIKKQKGSQKR